MSKPTNMDEIINLDKELNKANPISRFLNSEIEAWDKAVNIYNERSIGNSKVINSHVSAVFKNSSEGISNLQGISLGLKALFNDKALAQISPETMKKINDRNTKFAGKEDYEKAVLGVAKEAWNIGDRAAAGLEVVAKNITFAIRNLNTAAQHTFQKVDNEISTAMAANFKEAFEVIKGGVDLFNKATKAVGNVLGKCSQALSNVAQKVTGRIEGKIVPVALDAVNKIDTSVKKIQTNIVEPLAKEVDKGVKAIGAEISKVKDQGLKKYMGDLVKKTVIDPINTKLEKAESNFKANVNKAVAVPGQIRERINTKLQKTEQKIANRVNTILEAPGKIKKGIEEVKRGVQKGISDSLKDMGNQLDPDTQKAVKNLGTSIKSPASANMSEKKAGQGKASPPIPSNNKKGGGKSM